VIEPDDVVTPDEERIALVTISKHLGE